MKNTIRFVLAVFAAVALSACQGTYQIPVPGGTVMIGGQQRGYPQQYAEGGHGGPPGPRREGQEYQQSRARFAQEDREVFEGRGEPRLVDGGGEYSRTKWQNGINRHGFHVRATISAFNGALTMEERPALGKKLEDWAEGVYASSGKTHIPSDKEATDELRRMLRHNNVRVKLSDRLSDEFIPQERTLISREKIEEKDVPRESVAELQRKAIEQFKQKGTNDMVTDGRYYDKL
ncbi:MAG: hypothetical protein V4686_01995 [Patescibacteria group bacterium]